jgi:hypothetical protein
MKTLNLNDIVYVHLTPAGEKLWADYLNEFPYTKAHPDIDVFAREKNRHYAGDFRYSFSLWELAQIFGSQCYIGAEPFFEDNEIELEKYPSWVTIDQANALAKLPCKRHDPSTTYRYCAVCGIFDCQGKARK